ncbi:MAG: MipA/OmpV family protein, partial [Pseudomonadota bacterium]
MRAIIAIAALFAASASSLAADVDVEPVEIPAAIEARDIIFDLGAAVTLGPKFPGARVYDPGAVPLFRLQFLRVPVFGEVVTGKVSYFSVFPSIEVTGRRDDADAAYLQGIPDRDLSVGIGPGVNVRYGPVRAYATARYGFFGHNGFTGEVGVDFIAKPIERWELSLGPTLSWADGEYMDYYFGVPAAAAVLPAYDAQGGIKDLGVRAETTYELNEKWRIHGRA